MRFGAHLSLEFGVGSWESRNGMELKLHPASGMSLGLHSLSSDVAFGGVAQNALDVCGCSGATVDFVKNGLVPRPALRNAKLRPGLTY